MYDYLIAVGVALAGLAVIWFAFNSVSEADVTVERTAANRQPRPKKQVRAPSQRYKEDVLDQETEKLIAEEIARNPSGLSKDSKVVDPPTLEEVRSRHHVREERKSGAAFAQPAAVSERQRLIDKELGFQSVEQKPKKKKEKSIDKQPDDMDEDDMDRKLAQFFRNSKGRSRPSKITIDDDAPAAGAGTGGRVSIKGDISSARTWQ